MILFGPAGNDALFRQEGHTSSVDAPGWIKKMGLDAFEYSAGRGVNLSEDTARAIGQKAKESGITLSIHAPYYISCAAWEGDKRDNSVKYLLDAARALDLMGGTRVIFHVGSPTRYSREEAIRISTETVRKALNALDENGLSHMRLCPETMGRPSQLGTLSETLSLCLTDERLIPTLDFGHLHTMGRGAMNTRDDFRRVLDELLDTLGEDRARHFHAHFSRIDYGEKGEKRHMCFSDEGYGPDFALLAPLLSEYRLEPTVICESAGTQARDALTMKKACGLI